MQIGVVPLHCLCSNHSTYIFGPTCSLHLQRILTQTNFWRRDAAWYHWGCRVSTKVLALGIFAILMNRNVGSVMVAESSYLKKVQTKKLAWGIGGVWRFWRISNWSYMSKGVIHVYLGPICYPSELSDIPYPPLHFLGWDIFSLSYSKTALITYCAKGGNCTNVP